MIDLFGTAWLLPVGSAVFAVGMYTVLWLQSRAFDRKYGTDRD